MVHDVELSIPKRTQGPSDVVFNVNKDGDKLATLQASKGPVVWFPLGTSYG
jgi:hypothetical protein